VQFWKMHGIGNDFVVIADMDNAFTVTPEFVRAVCDRRYGVGGDALIRIGRSDNGLAFMDYWNCDGTTAEMCGNGACCVGKWLGDRGLASETLELDTRDGVKPVWLSRAGDGLVESVRIGMGLPRFEDDPTERVVCGDETLTISAVSMGNPHAVLFVDDVDKAPLEHIGPLLQAHERFPESVNVEVATVRVDGSIAERTFERGVGETLACGTGASAVAVAAQRLGLVGERVEMDLRGGHLILEWTPGESVYLTCEPTEVFSGELSALPSLHSA
jgi:diaminopimelate epimerase